MVKQYVVESIFAAVCFVRVDFVIVVDVMVAFCVKFVVLVVGTRVI